MDTKQDILNYILGLIAKENGIAIRAQDKLVDSGLDSLGVIVFLIGLDSKYGVLTGVPDGSEYEELKLATITMKELVILCEKSLAVKQATE
jgi:hypothetical protein